MSKSKCFPEGPQPRKEGWILLIQPRTVPEHGNVFRNAAFVKNYFVPRLGRTVLAPHLAEYD
jgi:hypothetical protein